MGIDRLVLIGLSGVGKSTVARIIGERLGWDVEDSDEAIASMTGAPAAEIIATRGEPTFREFERRAIAMATLRERLVIATGGGVVVLQENRERLWRDSLVVWLDAPTVTLQDRLAKDAEEVRLHSSRLDELRAARSHLYAMADLAVCTEGRAPGEVAEMVVEALEGWRDGRQKSREKIRWPSDAAPRVTTVSPCEGFVT